MRPALALAALALPRAASACAVCFGAADGQSGLATGVWWGIVVLLTVTMSLCGGIGWALWSVEKGRKELDA